MRGLQAKERHVAPLESTAVEIVLRMNDTNIIIYIDVYIYIISSWPLGAIYIYIYVLYRHGLLVQQVVGWSLDSCLFYQVFPWQGELILGTCLSDVPPSMHFQL